MCPAAPDRPDRVDDKSGGQTIAARNFRFTGSTTSQCPAFREQFRAGSAVNRAIDSAAAQQASIRGIHNGIDLELRDVAADNVDLSGTAQNVSDRSSGRSRRQSPVYFVGHRFILYDRAISFPLAAHRLRRCIGKHPTERQRHLLIFQ